MTSDSALYNFLEKYKEDRTWNLEESDDRTWNSEESDVEENKTPGEIFDSLKEILEKEPHLVNEAVFREKSPLHLVLSNRELSTLSIVKLMLSYGARVDRSDRYGDTPLLVALEYHREQDVIRALLEKGACVKATSSQGQSVLCYALYGGGYEELVQLILDAGCSPDLCELHFGWGLLCATQLGASTNKEVIQQLIKMKVNLNRVDEVGCSPLCYVLRNGVEFWVIDLLLAAGGSLNACMKHTSPLHCATSECTSDRHVPILRADVIKKLLKLAKKYNPFEYLSDLTPLQRALRYRSAEKEVIQMLFDHQRGSHTIRDDHRNTLLHLAVSNRYSKPSVIEFLIDIGVNVDLVNDEDETPLHLAVSNSQSSIIKMLLKAGSSVNAMNRSGDNPLQQAVNSMVFFSKEGVNILKILFIAGSRIGHATVRRFVGRVIYNRRKIVDNYCNMLVKFYLFKNPDFHIQHVIQDHPDYATLSAFGADCERELHDMRSTIVGEGCTLRDVLDDRYSHRIVKYDFDQLEVIANNTFPVYFDIIAAKIIGRLPIEEILREVHVFTPKCISGQEEMVTLNYHVVCNISDWLGDTDLLTFILAFRKRDRGMCTARVSYADV